VVLAALTVVFVELDEGHLRSCAWAWSVIRSWAPTQQTFVLGGQLDSIFICPEDPVKKDSSSWAIMQRFQQILVKSLST
jgi:hypothetical protein